MKRYMYCSRNEPVIPPQHRSAILYIANKQISPLDEKIGHLHDVASTFPKENYLTCEAIFAHLNRLSQRSAETFMSPRKLAAIWAPVLFHVASAQWNVSELENAVAVISQETTAIEIITAHFSSIFVLKKKTP